MANKKSKMIGIYDKCVNMYVYDLAPENSHCLDVGCWTGNLGRKLIRSKKCSVDGIDNNAEALKKATKNGYGGVYNIDLNSDGAKINKITQKYDCIICADILEHLANPEQALSLLIKKLKKDGLIIISIPNIGFIKQRAELLLGRFNYNPNGGIMDKTHLRFYTFKSVQQMCQDAGYEIESASGYSLVKNKFFFLRYLAKIWPSLFAVQFLLRLKYPNGHTHHDEKDN